MKKRETIKFATSEHEMIDHRIFGCVDCNDLFQTSYNELTALVTTSKALSSNDQADRAVSLK